ncbi:beta-galactosidase [Rosistilla ulvae]|nr:beta-galactosidase [Rosistilla ulvae]
MVTPKSAAHPLCKGLLLRTSWSKLEPRRGRYDFSDIDRQIEVAERSARDPKSLAFSLAISAGLGGGPQGANYPAWLIDEGVETMPIQFRREEGLVPKMWDPLFQKRLKNLADAVSQKFAKDKRLKLVYVPQATANGVEGHFNGNSNAVLARNGLTQDVWVGAVKQAAISFADSFDDCAIAVEVHEVLGSPQIPMRILNELYEDPKYRDQIGAGMWWISGGMKYQPALVEALKKYPGDIYGQIIGNSSQPHRFGDRSGDFTAVYRQAMELDVRYLEAWNFEFDYNTQNQNIENFNKYAHQKYELGVANPPVPTFTKPELTSRGTSRGPRDFQGMRRRPPR